MKIKDVEDLVGKFAGERILSTCIRVQKLVLLDPAACSRYVSVHFVKDVRTYGRTDARMNHLLPLLYSTLSLLPPYSKSTIYSLNHLIHTVILILFLPPY